MNKKLLIVAGEAMATAEQIPFSVRGLIDSASEILVITPTLPGRLDWIASDTDKATRQAENRLRSILRQLDPVDAETGGAVGSDDPLQAVSDAVREFEPGHMLIGLRSEERSDWQERGLISDMTERFDVPITVFQLP